MTFRLYCWCMRFQFKYNDFHADLCLACCLKLRRHRSKTLLDVDKEGSNRRDTRREEPRTWGVELMQMTRWWAEETMDKGLCRWADPSGIYRLHWITSQMGWVGPDTSRDFLLIFYGVSQCQEWEMSGVIIILKCEWVQSITGLQFSMLLPREWWKNVFFATKFWNSNQKGYFPT